MGSASLRDVYKRQAFERAAVQQVSRDVVEPEALAQVVQLLCGFHNVQPTMISAQERRTERAIISSSSVRMTRTGTRLEFLEITAAVFALRDLSSSMPRKFNPSQMRARTMGAFSPMPPAKTSVSKPPSAAAKEPIHFFADVYKRQGQRR